MTSGTLPARIEALRASGLSWERVSERLGLSVWLVRVTADRERERRQGGGVSQERRAAGHDPLPVGHPLAALDRGCGV